MRPCLLVHKNCPHCNVHLLVSKTIQFKFTEITCCVDIMWRGKSQNKTNEEHPWCKQFRNNADTICYKPFSKCFHGTLIDKVLLKLTIDPTFYILGFYFFSGTSAWDCTSCTDTLSKVWPWHVPSAKYFFLAVLSTWRTHERKSDHAYSKNLEGNVLRETYPNLWHIHTFSEMLPMSTRSDWPTGAWPQGCRVRNPVGLPNVCFVYCFHLAESRTNLKMGHVG